ncbi:MAG: energy transducer TonB [Rhodothermales bacterium]|jgi:protein TonB
MSRSFLVGKFLPAYGNTFGRLPERELTSKGLSNEALKQRFRERGASYMRRRREYLIMGQVGLIMAIAMTTGAFRVSLTGGETLDYVMPDQEVVQMEEIIQTAQIEKPPPPPRPPIPVEVPNDEVLEDIDLDLDASLDLNEMIVDLPPPPAEPAEEEEEEIFLIVEKMPEIIGGLSELYKYVSYPEIARKAKIEGTVVVQIVVTPEGTPSQPTVLRGVHELLDKEAVQGVMQLAFKPAMQRARAVPVYMTIPVRFELN